MKTGISETLGIYLTCPDSVYQPVHAPTTPITLDQSTRTALSSVEELQRSICLRLPYVSLLASRLATDSQVDQDTRIGDVSQTGQWAPFNPHYGVSSSYYSCLPICR